MAHLQLKNVPERVHRQLRRYARRKGRSLRDIVLGAVERELDSEAFAERLRRRAAVDFGRSAASLLDEARRERGS